MKLSALPPFVRAGFVLLAAAPLHAAFQAGAARIDITPDYFPVVINGNMLSKTADKVVSPIHARAIVVADADTRAALVTVDTCMMPRELLDEAKARAAQATGIPAANLFISATHAHSAPSCMGALGTDPDPRYPRILIAKLTEAIVKAANNLEPARMGYAVGQAPEHTALRRWVRRADKMKTDPFGNLTVRANMHPGYLSPEATGESGPEDPDLPIVLFQALDGRPIAAYANFSMHYFSVPSISADYFGLFCDQLEAHLNQHRPVGDRSPPVVAALSHGCSGDIWRRDYTKPAPEKQPTLEEFTDGLLTIAKATLARVRFQSDPPVAMAEARFPLKYRVPDAQRLLWASNIVASLEGRAPTNTTEVYAREQVILHERQETEVVLQALRIGSLGITGMPNEVYALTGLKLKHLSPLDYTITVDLANGGDGYIPPPEQHVLGGYNTWAARSAGLEVQAEPRMMETCLQLLEQVSGQPRRIPDPGIGPFTRALLDSKPTAFWRFEDYAGPRALDTANHFDGFYEDGVVFWLEGPDSAKTHGPDRINRCAHFAGGRMRARVPGLKDRYSVSAWIWNGLVTDARPVSGWFFSRGWNHAFEAPGDHLGIGGRDNHEGRLLFSTGDRGRTAAGKTVMQRWTWHHVRLDREGDRVRVYLDNAAQPEIDTEAPLTIPPFTDQVFIGGRNDNHSNWEGRLDEVAVWRR